MPSAFLTTPSTISKQLGSLSSLLQASPSPKGDAGLQATLMQGQQEFGSVPQKQVGTSFQSESLSPFDAPKKMNPADLFGQQQSVSAPTNTFGRNGGSLGSLGGDLSFLDQFDQSFATAAAEQGLDANWLKALAAMEGGWGAGAVSGAGAIGIMQIMPGGYGALEAMYPNWQNDPGQNIRLGAAILRAKINENGGDINLGTQRYLGVGTDPYTGVTTGQYLSNIQGYYNQLNQSGGSFGGGDLGSVFVNGEVPDWGEFGAESSNGYYQYGTQYGMNGTQHTGADVPMAVGSAYRAPMGGVVTCGGTGSGSGGDGSGCSGFGDYYGNGAGRVEVLLDNGAVLIFGHSSTSALQPGQRFNAGDILGTSGGMNSAHIHLEARVKDPSTPSGWRIVDPRSVIGGGSFGGQQSGSQGQYGSFAQQIRSFLQNRR